MSGELLQVMPEHCPRCGQLLHSNVCVNCEVVLCPGAGRTVVIVHLETTAPLSEEEQRLLLAARTLVWHIRRAQGARNN